MKMFSKKRENLKLKKKEKKKDPNVLTQFSAILDSQLRSLGSLRKLVETKGLIIIQKDHYFNVLDENKSLKKANHEHEKKLCHVETELNRWIEISYWNELKNERDKMEKSFLFDEIDTLRMQKAQCEEMMAEINKEKERLESENQALIESRRVEEEETCIKKEIINTSFEAIQSPLDETLVLCYENDNNSVIEATNYQSFDRTEVQILTDFEQQED